jgi:hypothetical protein
MEDVYKLCEKLKANGHNLKDIKVYLGNDDELNGIHAAWCIDTLSPNCLGHKYMIDLINEDSNNPKVTDLSVLLS